MLEQKKREKSRKEAQYYMYPMYLICLFFSYVPQKLGRMIFCVFWAF